MADLDTMMPPAGIGDETEEQRLRRLSPLAQGMPPMAVGPSSAATRTPSMPPSGTAPTPRSDANAMPPAGMNAPPAAALAQPSMPPAGKAEMAAPDAVQSKMPPANVGPQTKNYNDLSAEGQPKLTGWKNILDKVGSFLPFGKAIEREIGGTPQNYDAKLNQAAVRAAKEQSIGRTQGEEERATAEEKRKEEAEPTNQKFGAARARKEEADADALENKPDQEHQDIQKEFSDALAKGDQARIDALTPRVRQYIDATAKPGAEKGTKEQLQAQIAAADAKGDTATVKTLQDRLKKIDPEGQQRIVINQGNVNDKKQNAKDIAAAIQAGDQPPTLTGLRENTAQVRAELARSGFNLARAESDWHATQKHLATMNGAQQERLRQAVGFTKDSLSQVEDIYNQWQQVGKTSEWKTFNKASLATAKQLPGAPGNLAHRLEARVADLTSELGTVYKGGNSSTDESLKLAAKNLEGDWNEKTFKDAIGDIRKSIEIRENSIKHSQPAGVSADSPYTPTNEKPTEPPREPHEGMKWQQNKKTGEFREVPIG